VAKPANTLVASILDCDFRKLGAEVAAVDAHVDHDQVDVMDGHFVPNLSFGFPILEAMRKLTKRPLEADLMISNPDRYAAQYAKAGADYVIIHVEASADPRRTFQEIREAGGKPGISISPGTSEEAVRAFLPEVDMALVMTVKPGFGGQSFMLEQLERVKRIRQWSDEQGLDLDIEVDGGVKPDTAKLAVAAGANLLVTGSYIYRSDDYQQAIATFRSQIA
jgi:ribulose-phosphate 3-epimerase